MRNNRAVFPDKSDFAFNLIALLIDITSKNKSVGNPTDLFLSVYDVLIISAFYSLHIIQYKVRDSETSRANTDFYMRLHFAVEV